MSLTYALIFGILVFVGLPGSEKKYKDWGWTSGCWGGVEGGLKSATGTYYVLLNVYGDKCVSYSLKSSGR